MSKKKELSILKEILKNPLPSREALEVIASHNSMPFSYHKLNQLTGLAVWPLVDKILRTVKKRGNVHLYIESLDIGKNGIWTLILNDGDGKTILVFSQDKIIEERGGDVPLAPIPRYAEMPPSHQGSIDSLTIPGEESANPEERPLDGNPGFGEEI